MQGVQPVVSPLCGSMAPCEGSKIILPVSAEGTLAAIPAPAPFKVVEWGPCQWGHCFRQTCHGTWMQLPAPCPGQPSPTTKQPVPACFSSNSFPWITCIQLDYNSVSLYFFTMSLIINHFSVFWLVLISISNHIPATQSLSNMWEISSEKSKTLPDRCFKFYIGQETSHCSGFCLCFFFNPFVKSVLCCVSYAPKVADYNPTYLLPWSSVRSCDQASGAPWEQSRAVVQTHSTVLMLHADVPWAGWSLIPWETGTRDCSAVHLSYLCETAESPKKHQWDLQE